MRQRLCCIRKSLSFIYQSLFFIYRVGWGKGGGVGSSYLSRINRYLSRMNRYLSGINRYVSRINYIWIVIFHVSIVIFHTSIVIFHTSIVIFHVMGHDMSCDVMSWHALSCRVMSWVRSCHAMTCSCQQLLKPALVWISLRSFRQFGKLWTDAYGWQSCR